MVNGFLSKIKIDLVIKRWLLLRQNKFRSFLQMRNLVLNIVITLITVVVCFHFLSEPKTNPDYESVQNTETTYVSMIQLLANPEKYHNKKIFVKGFVHLQFESNGVYLHEEDFRKRLSKNAVWLVVNNDDAKENPVTIDQYWTIEGTFDATQKGHGGIYSGTIKNIKNLGQ